MLTLSTNRGINATINCGLEYLYNPLMEYKDFAKNLKELQSEKGLKTQIDLARFIGVSKSFVSVLLLGEKLPSMSTALEICKKFDVNLDWLMLNKGDKLQNKAIKSSFYQDFDRLSPEQQKQVAQYVAFIASQTPEITPKPENKSLTTTVENVGGGGG